MPVTPTIITLKLVGLCLHAAFILSLMHFQRPPSKHVVLQSCGASSRFFCVPGSLCLPSDSYTFFITLSHTRQGLVSNRGCVGITLRERFCSLALLARNGCAVPRQLAAFNRFVFSNENFADVFVCLFASSLYFTRHCHVWLHRLVDSADALVMVIALSLLLLPPLRLLFLINVQIRPIRWNFRSRGRERPLKRCSLHPTRMRSAFSPTPGDWSCRSCCTTSKIDCLTASTSEHSSLSPPTPSSPTSLLSITTFSAGQSLGKVISRVTSAMQRVAKLQKTALLAGSCRCLFPRRHSLHC